jgi:hypothetical protein
MRSRIRTVLLIAAVGAALAGCASPSPVETDVEAGTGPWPSNGFPGFYMVSEEIQEYCPNGEEYLGGSQITTVIPEDDLDSLEGYACVFAEPESGSLDTVDEFAYRVDEGLGDLVEAYAATTYAFEGDCPDPLPIEASYPHVRVEYDGVGYTLTAAGCGDSASVDDAVAGLRVTEVAHDNVTFEEYEESGL